MSEITYRVASLLDAKAIVSFYNQVGGETTYLSFGQDEYPMNEELQEKRLLEVSLQKNSTILLALSEEQIVGIATLTSSQKKKSAHEGEFGIVVEEAFWGKGIGSALIQRILRFAKNNTITTRVWLITRTDNLKAVELYKRFGFVLEGHMKHSTLVDGVYYDTYVMGLLF